MKKSIWELLKPYCATIMIWNLYFKGTLTYENRSVPKIYTSLFRVGFLSGYPIARKNPDLGNKKFPGYPEDLAKFRGLKSRDSKIPESRGSVKNPGNYQTILKNFRWSENRKNPKFFKGISNFDLAQNEKSRKSHFFIHIGYPDKKPTLVNNNSLLLTDYMIQISYLVIS